MATEVDQTGPETPNSGSQIREYEPPTLTPLGTAEEAMADVGGFSGF